MGVRLRVGHGAWGLMEKFDSQHLRSAGVDVEAPRTDECLIGARELGSHCTDVVDRHHVCSLHGSARRRERRAERKLVSSQIWTYSSMGVRLQ